MNDLELSPNHRDEPESLTENIGSVESLRSPLSLDTHDGIQFSWDLIDASLEKNNLNTILADLSTEEALRFFTIQRRMLERMDNRLTELDNQYNIERDDNGEYLEEHTIQEEDPETGEITEINLMALDNDIKQYHEMIDEYEREYREQHALDQTSSSLEALAVETSESTPEADEAMDAEVEALAEEVAEAESPEEVARIIDETPKERSNRLFGESANNVRGVGVMGTILAVIEQLWDQAKGWLRNQTERFRNWRNNVDIQNPLRRNLEARNLRSTDELELPPEQQDYYNNSVEACNHYRIPADRGVPMLFAIYRRESGLGREMHNEGSSATGLSQFVNDTWESFIESQGAEMVRLGIASPEDIADPKDESRTVRANNSRLMAYATAWLLNRNYQTLRQNDLIDSWYQEDAPFRLYATHHLGSGDGPKYLRYRQTGDRSILASMSNPHKISEDGYNRTQTFTDEYIERFTIERSSDTDNTSNSSA